MTEKIEHNNIYEAVLGIYQDIGYVFKGGKVDASGMKYAYAGEVDFIKAIRPTMIKHGVIAYPSEIKDVDSKIVHGEKVYHKTNSIVKTTTINASATYIFKFVHANSETFIEVSARGEGADTMDKAFNKASTGALKYALRQTFIIETGDDPDKVASPSEDYEMLERAKVDLKKDFEAKMDYIINIESQELSKTPLETLENLKKSSKFYDAKNKLKKSGMEKEAKELEEVINYKIKELSND